jgi:hypothetical protein
MLIIISVIAISLAFLFFQAKSKVRSSEFGKEARYIACNELEVPLSYFNYSVQNEIEDIKKSALHLKEIEPFYGSLSWPRLLAWTVYGGYRYDCHNAYFNEDISAMQRLKTSGVTYEQMVKEANKEHKAKKKLRHH